MARAEDISTSILFLVEDIDGSFDESKLSDFTEKFIEAAHKFIMMSANKVLPQAYDHITKQHPEVSFEKQAFIEAGQAVFRNMNPKRIYDEVKVMVIKHGWKIGIIAAFWEIFEHFGVPAILHIMGYPNLAIATGVLPVGIGEVVAYPLFFKLLGKLDKDKDKALNDKANRPFNDREVKEEFFARLDPFVEKIYG